MHVQIPPAPPRPLISTERQELLDEIQSLKNALYLREMHINLLNELVNTYRRKTDLLDEVIK